MLAILACVSFDDERVLAIGLFVGQGAGSGRSAVAVGDSSTARRWIPVLTVGGVETADPSRANRDPMVSTPMLAAPSGRPLDADAESHWPTM